MKIRILAAGLAITVGLTISWSGGANDLAAQTSGRVTLAPQAFTPIVSDQFTPAPVDQGKLTGLVGKHLGSIPGRLFNGQDETYLNVFEHPTGRRSISANNFHLEKCR